MLALELLDTGALAGLLGLPAITIAAITTAWAYTKNGQVKGERENADQARRGMEVFESRLAGANEWNVELEKQLAKCRGQLPEKDLLVTTLEERVAAQKEHIDKLIDWSPLYTAIEKHTKEANAEWAAQAGERERIVREVGERLDSILDRLDAIDSRLGPQ